MDKLTLEEKKLKEEADEARLKASHDSAHLADRHTEARDARIVSVKKAIADAKVLRDAREADGLKETEGAKIDREAKEAKDLKEAGVLNVIEPFTLDSNNLALLSVSDKLAEVIEYLNRK